MAAPQASSRLEMLQARFQQKRLQEKEQKLLQLYDQQQQRAYLVVQRGSAGSTGSNQGSSVSHHSVTKTTTTTHSSTAAQGGKVRQMFDERRQTTVKGIDRSYPLEPLDNKPKKYVTSNGHVPSKPQNGTVTRQTVTVRRSTRADVNSNVNGGKPVVSYHEEVSHESYDNDDEFGNENDNDRYTNGNHQNVNRNGQVHIEEIVDDDVLTRNRMLAKIHLMELDKNMRHRVSNDLESEQFPEDLMVDVPDKVSKKPATRKLSQAEARLERFKNANAKRGNITTTVTRKRSIEPIFPARTSPRVTKSPSPDPAVRKSSGSTTRTSAHLVRRSVPASPTKSPDFIPRRGSAGAKSPEPKSTRNSTRTAAKSSEVSGSSKAAQVTKTPDVVDVSDFENNCQLQNSPDDSTPTKVTPTVTKKNAEAFVLEFDAPSDLGDNVTVPAKKPLPRKQPLETQKQRSPTASPYPRPLSSLSTASSSSSARGQTPGGSAGKMATKSRTQGPGARGPPSGKISAGVVSNDALVACKTCGRRFAQERVALHEQICAKTGAKKRKQFDAMMFRVKGTDLEPFVKKGGFKKATESKNKKPEVKSNWRRKHEDFINAIRSAKQVQAHLAAGGKLSDLPPPPASDTSDYIQCPHCGRKFNAGAAERHIPKCQTMMHNKPNPRAPPKPKR